MKLESLLPQAKKFLKKTRFVKINEQAAEKLTPLLKKRRTRPAFRDFRGQPLFFYLLVAGLNFCFWHKSPKKKLRYRGHSGSVALGYLILKSLKDYRRLLRPEFLASFPAAAYSAILEDSLGELALRNERIKILSEIGRFLKKHNFGKVVEKYRAKDVNALAGFLVKNLPFTFRDEVKIKYTTIPFYKKVRLLVADLSRLAGIKFKNRDKLLVYADYRIPQTLIHYGLLDLSEELKGKIKNKQLLRSGSEAEVALRAGAVAAAEILKRKTGLSYPELDLWLWIISKKLPKSAIPHHRTLTRFY